MRAVVDLSLCQGYGNCLAAGPTVFDLDDSGLAVVLVDEIDTPELEAEVRAAIPMCPAAAIALQD